MLTGTVVAAQEVQAVLVEVRRARGRPVLPAWRRTADELDDVVGRCVADPDGVDAGEIAALTFQVEAAARWRIDRYGVDEYAEGRRRVAVALAQLAAAIREQIVLTANSDRDSTAPVEIHQSGASRISPQRCKRATSR